MIIFTTGIDIDVPILRIVINFDIPTRIIDPFNGREGDAKKYMQRIGRMGHYGTKGIAITLYDRQEERDHLQKILDHYQMGDKMKVLESPEQLRSLLDLPPLRGNIDLQRGNTETTDNSK